MNMSNITATTTTTTNSLAKTAAEEEEEEEEKDKQIANESKTTTTTTATCSDFIIYYKGVPLKLIWNIKETALLPKKTDVVLHVKRLCTSASDKHGLVFLLTTNQQLYTGQQPPQQQQLENDTLTLNLLLSNIIDVDYCSRTQQIFAVNNKGEVHMQHLEALHNNWTKLVFDPLELNETGIHIEQVCCAAESALFLSATGDTYSWGNCGEVLVAHNQPKQVRLYDHTKLNLLQMAAGDDFFVLLLRPRGAGSSQEQDLFQVGKNLLHTQLHTFGAINNGLLGIGDHMRRNNVQHLSKMDGLGVHQISAAHKQALALLLDGRVFAWGRDDLSTPTEIVFGRGVLAAQCTPLDILTLKVEQQQLPLAPPAYEPTPLTLNTTTSALLASADFSVYNNCLPALMKHTELRDAFMTTQTLMKQLLIQRHTLLALKLYVMQQHAQHGLISLCQLFEQLLHLHAAFLSALLDWCLSRNAEFALMQHVDTAVECFRRYTQSYCNLLAWNQFAGHIAAFQQAQPQHLPLDLGLMQFLPQTLNACYMRVLQPLPACSEALHKLRGFTAYYRLQVQLAEQTLRFWLPRERNSKLSKLSAHLERRVLLSSYEVPLKLAQPSSSLLGGNHVLILCNDAFFHVNGNSVQRYAIRTLWLRDKTANSFCIITPESTLLLSAREPQEKQRWWQELQQLLRLEFGANNSQRCLSYKFSANHALYAQVLAVGQWREGLMHGVCHLEYENGKFYAGQMRNGQIEGFGKMLIPGVGLYEGSYKAGKFHGQGVYEMRDGAVYEGYFRGGLFHGHGVLRSNYFTYVGEYQSNMRCGYGILDDMISCEKYMGMFADNKRHGAGICVTVEGDYFEGNFVNDELMGHGVAIFENDDYYEGELSISGPSGKGQYFMANGGVAGEEQSTGSILSGQLAGNWKNVRIVSGNLALQQTFAKTSASFGTFVLNNQLKWRALFSDFTEELLGAHELQTGILWQRISRYMRRQKKREEMREMQELEWAAMAQQNQAKEQIKDNYLMRNIVLSLNNNNINNNNNNNHIEKNMQKLPSVFYFKNTSQPTNADVNSLAGDIQTLLLDSEGENNSLLERRARSQETLYEEDLEQQIEWEPHTNSSLNSWHNDSAVSLHSSSMGSMLNVHTAENVSAEKSEGGSSRGSNTSSSYSNASSLLEGYHNLAPTFGQKSPLTAVDLEHIQQYLQLAFQDNQHPLHALNQRIASLFYTAYGCWRVKPTPYFTKQAMHEWQYISRRVYAIVRCLFPALPLDHCVLEETREVVSHVTLLSPVMLSESIYSTLFVLYANKYNKKDEIYRQNLQRAEKLTDDELAQQLHLESALIPLIRHEHFAVAIQTLKQLQEKYSPKSMLTVIENCMQQITETQQLLDTPPGSTQLSADSMMPLTLFLVMRASVPHLGAELALLDDLTCGSSFQFEMNGLAGYCYTTLKACYEHITTELFSRAS